MKNRIFCTVLICILSICFCLSLGGCTKSEKETETTDIQKKVDEEIDEAREIIEVYLYDRTTESEKQQLKKQIESMEGVVSIEYISKEEAYEKAIEKLGKNALELAGYTKNSHPFPTYFTIKVKNQSYINKIVEKLNQYKFINELSYYDSNKSNGDDRELRTYLTMKEIQNNK